MLAATTAPSRGRRRPELLRAVRTAKKMEATGAALGAALEVGDQPAAGREAPCLGRWLPSGLVGFVGEKSLGAGCLSAWSSSSEQRDPAAGALSLGVEDVRGPTGGKAVGGCLTQTVQTVPEFL